MDRLLDHLRGLVRVRKVGEVGGDDEPLVVERFGGPRPRRPRRGDTKPMAVCPTRRDWRAATGSTRPRRAGPRARRR